MTERQTGRLERSDCWRLYCDEEAEVNIVDENGEFRTSVCEECAESLVEGAFWDYTER